MFGFFFLCLIIQHIIVTSSIGTECECTPLQTSFLEELRIQLNTIKSFSRKENRLEPAKDVVSEYVKKFIQDGSTSVDHLHTHLQKLYKKEFLITDLTILEMAETLADGLALQTPPTSSLACQETHSASSPTLHKPLFSKPVVYHASVCCQAVNKSTRKDCSSFLKDEVSHSFIQVSISQSEEEGRYLIAIQDSTYYIAFQSEPNIVQWPKKYKSFREGTIVNF